MPRSVVPLAAAWATLAALARGEEEFFLPSQIRRHSLEPASPFCPLHHFAELHGGPVSGDSRLDYLVRGLVNGETPCFQACIAGARDVAQLSHDDAERAQKACRACVDVEAEAQQTVVLRAMSAEQNAGCKVAEPVKDRCFVTPQVKYAVVDIRERRSLNGPRENFPTSVTGGWWLLPDMVRANLTEGLFAKTDTCSKICMPSDGVGSIFSVVFELFTAALETGCSMVYPEIFRVAHGVELDELNDFFRADANCLVGDRHDELAEMTHRIVGGKNEEVADISNHYAHGGSPAGTVYYMSRYKMCGQAAEHALRLSHLRGGMHVCGRRHAGVLSRLVLRAKFESGQRRPTAVPPPPPFVALATSSAATQVSGTAWFDPLFDARPDGRLQLSVVMHVRRGDVNKNYGAEHSGGGGIYASHFVPLEVVTGALSILMTAWAPLAEKLGLFFDIHVASEGVEDDFPTTEWHRIVHGVGKMNYRLLPYEGQKEQGNLEREYAAANLTALDTMGQMLDADILMADGKSLFSLTANAWAVNSLFLTYPWLLQLGAPLDHVAENGTSTTPLNLEALPEETPLHPVYQDMVRKNGLGLNHPGLTLLEDAHRSEDYHSELTLLYEHRQTAVLQGLLANLVAKKRRALERGAHFNWMGY